MNSLRLAVPAAGLVTAQVGAIGRIGAFDASPGDWSYNNTYEDQDSALIGSKGYFKWPTLSADEQPVVAMTLDITNNLTTPDEEAVVGSYHPDDFAARSRQIVIRVTYKWDDADMYRRILTNSPSGTSWSPIPFTSELTGDNHAFEAQLESAADVSGLSNPYRLTFRANKVVWSVDGPPAFAAGRIIMQNYVGLVVEPDSGDYAQLILDNEQASYVWPS